MREKRSSTRFSAAPWMRWLVPLALALLALGLLGVVVLTLLP